MTGLAVMLAVALATETAPSASVAADVNAGPVRKGGHVVQPPVWESAPDSDLIGLNFPRTAIAMHQPGRVVLHCRVTKTGLASQCKAVSEFPAGLGFGDAALKIADSFRFRPQMVDGQPSDDGEVNIPINFALPKVNQQIRWVRTPTDSELLRNRPEYDIKEHVGGSATFQCAVSPSGVLHRCVVLSELPADRGFAEAALRLTAFFRTEPYQQEIPGRENRVTVPVQWAGIGDTGEYVPAHEFVVTKVPWLATPMRADVAAAYPAGAAAAKLAGSAWLRCRVAGDGSLVNCVDGVDLPADAGFGKAAQILVPKFRTETTYQHVSLVGAWIDVEVAFLPEMLGDQGTADASAWRVLNGPDAATVAAAFPEKAKREGLSQGDVSLECSIGRDGGLSECVVADEIPANLGFGAAAKALAQQVRLVAWNGTPLAGRQVRFPIRIFATPPAKAR